MSPRKTDECTFLLRMHSSACVRQQAMVVTPAQDAADARFPAFGQAVGPDCRSFLLLDGIARRVSHPASFSCACKVHDKVSALHKSAAPLLKLLQCRHHPCCGDATSAWQTPPLHGRPYLYSADATSPLPDPCRQEHQVRSSSLALYMDGPAP